MGVAMPHPVVPSRICEVQRGDNKLLGASSIDRLSRMNETTEFPRPLAAAPTPVVLAAQHLEGYRGEWYICGGWAVDLLLGKETRPHLDVDVAVFQHEQRDLHEHLSGWSALGHDDAVSETCPDQWDGRELSVPAHIHANIGSMAGTELDIQINTRVGRDWLLCENPRVTLPHEECVVDPEAWGVPMVSAAVVLYFKAAARGWRGGLPAPASTLRDHDQADFDGLLPTLTQLQRTWLYQAISVHDADHPWLQRLARSPRSTSTVTSE